LIINLYYLIAADLIKLFILQSVRVKPTYKSSFPAGAGKANQMGRKKIGRYENAFLATACFILSA